MGAKASGVAHIKMGVPQGSISGLTLFAVYINDIFHYIRHPSCTVVSYADDMNILIRTDSMDKAQNILNKVYTRINKWVFENRLVINKEETNCVVSGTFCTRANATNEFVTKEGKSCHVLAR